VFGQLLVAALGAAIFLRITGKEKNRRERYLLRRLEDQKQRLAARLAREAEKQAEAEAADEESIVLEPVGQAA
jgi:hypothetical protein